MLRRRIAQIAGLLLCLFALAAIATAQSAPIRYTVALDPQPTTHLLHISIDVDPVTSPSVEVAMPAWSPGSYNIHNAWRQVQEFSTVDGGGAPLRFEKVDKQTWRVFRGKDDKVTVKYKLYWTNYNEEYC